MGRRYFLILKIKMNNENTLLPILYNKLGGFLMGFSDGFFKKIENKTNVDKETILSLANKLQQGNMQDENVLREVIHDISKMTGKEVSLEKEQKIIDTVMNNNVPKDIEKYLGE